MSNTKTVITWDNVNELVEGLKKVIGTEMAEGYDSMITHQNCLLRWLNWIVKEMAEETGDRNLRLASKAIVDIYGRVAEDADTEEEKDRKEAFTSFLGRLTRESEDIRLTMGIASALTRFSLEAHLYIVTKAAEKGNSKALELLDYHKGLVADYLDIAQTLYDASVVPNA